MAQRLPRRRKRGCQQCGTLVPKRRIFRQAQYSAVMRSFPTSVRTWHLCRRCFQAMKTWDASLRALARQQAVV